MRIVTKLKETISSVFPIVLIVLLLSFTIAPLHFITIIKFLLGSLYTIIGLTLFLIGVDVGISPIGESIGSTLTSKKSLPLLLIFAFIIGFLVTIAEPDIEVFSSQIKSVYPFVNKTSLVLMIAVGVGLFTMIGLTRNIFHINLKLLLALLYAALFTLTLLSPRMFIGIAFDSGGATTGPMTVPFILALGVGVNAVSNVRKEDARDTFGLTGIASIGPIISVLLYSLLLNNKTPISNAPEQSIADSSLFHTFITSFLLYGKEAFISILPVIVLFLFFQFTFLHLPQKLLLRLSMALVWSYLGLTIFLVGVQGGFMDAGRQLGLILGQKAYENGAVWKIVLIGVGTVLGAVVVAAEPAVWVLTRQVETLSGGTIKRSLMLVFLMAASSFAIALCVIKIITALPLLYLLLALYFLALFLMLFSPSLFTSIAFDSGGVASGPITSTFVLSFTLGAGSIFSKESVQDVFGVIALIAASPLIAIQVLGIVYNIKQGRQNGK